LMAKLVWQLCHCICDRISNRIYNSMVLLYLQYHLENVPWDWDPFQ
jgi:hypothetical protein